MLEGILDRLSSGSGTTYRCCYCYTHFDVDESDERAGLLNCPKCGSDDVERSDP